MYTGDIYHSHIPLPTIMGRRRRIRCAGANKLVKSPRISSWDRSIVCLPSLYPKLCSTRNGIPVPRKKRSLLAKYGLIGKMHLEHDWSEERIFAEIRSVFNTAMNENPEFPVKIMMATGSGTKCLTIPAQSSSFQWTPKEVAGRADSCIYVLAMEPLKNEVSD